MTLWILSYQGIDKTYVFLTKDAAEKTAIKMIKKSKKQKSTLTLSSSKFNISETHIIDDNLNLAIKNTFPEYYL